MTLVTVLIPTKTHCDTIRFAIRSVQAQTIQDWELVVVGDGQPERLHGIMDQVMSHDNRIRYFPNPKGDGHGELYRYRALQEAKGKFVCYLGDDDMWFPNHLQTLCTTLEHVDVTHSIQTEASLNGDFSFLLNRLENLLTRWRMLNSKWNFFGPSCAGHRLDAYQKLPFGWRPKPVDMWSDLHMWRQWLSQEGCSFKTIESVTMLKFPAKPRNSFSIDERCMELAKWESKMNEPSFQQDVNNLMLNRLQPSHEISWYLAIAHELYAKESFILAEDVYQIVLRIYDKLPDAWHKVAIIHSKHQSDEYADVAIEKAISLRPNDVGYRLYSVHTKFMLGKYTEALREAQYAIKLNPGSSEAYSRTASYADKLGDLKLAVTYAEKAFSLSGLAKHETQWKWLVGKELKRG